MKKWMSLGTLVAIVSIVAWGCAQQDASQTDAGAPVVDGEHGDHAHDHEGGHEHGSETTLVANYCGSCGFAKGTDECCAEGAEKCSKCKMIAGSTLCCKLAGDFAGKELCGKCGEVAGSENCCNADLEKCAKCNMIAGSALCCVELTAGEEADHEHAEESGEN